MQTRFQDARHVYSLFQDMLKMYKEREKSLDDVIWAVYVVLCCIVYSFLFIFHSSCVILFLIMILILQASLLFEGHDDLIDGFIDFLPQSG
jgi:histone deacetylase complex regulatory component SIN3